MAAEWTYFVAKAPLCVAVVIRAGNLTRDLIGDGSPFTVTLCSADQADVADFVGSFSGREIDKTSSMALSFEPAQRIDVPWIAGGVAALECVTRQLVDLPDYTMVIGEVMHAHVPSETVAPLVKHGGMHHLGAPIRRSSVIASAEVVGGERPTLRVAATGPNGGGDPFHVFLHKPDSTVLDLGQHSPNEYGDLLVELDLPSLPDIEKCSVSVMRPGIKDGRSAVSTRRAGAE